MYQLKWEGKNEHGADDSNGDVDLDNDVNVDDDDDKIKLKSGQRPMQDLSLRTETWIRPCLYLLVLETKWLRRQRRQQRRDE